MLRFRGINDIPRNAKKQFQEKMNMNKSPGFDGLPTDFYRQMWPVMGDALVECFNYSVKHGELSLSLRRGVITLLQKREKILLLSRTSVRSH